MYFAIILFTVALAAMALNMPKRSFRSERGYRIYKRKSTIFQVSILMMVTAIIMFGIIYFSSHR